MENISQQESSIFGNMPQQRSLPNATAVLVLGITSLATCCCYGVVGLICSIIALVLARKDMELYRLNPMQFTPNSYSNLRGGKVCAIIGLIMSLLFVAVMIAFVAIIGLSALSDPEVMREWIRAHQ